MLVLSGGLSKLSIHDTKDIVTIVKIYNDDVDNFSKVSLNADTYYNTICNLIIEYQCVKI